MSQNEDRTETYPVEATVIEWNNEWGVAQSKATNARYSFWWETIIPPQGLFKAIDHIRAYVGERVILQVDDDENVVSVRLPYLAAFFEVVDTLNAEIKLHETAPNYLRLKRLQALKKKMMSAVKLLPDGRKNEVRFTYHELNMVVGVMIGYTQRVETILTWQTLSNGGPKPITILNAMVEIISAQTFSPGNSHATSHLRWLANKWEQHLGPQILTAARSGQDICQETLRQFCQISGAKQLEAAYKKLRRAHQKELAAQENES